MRVCLLIGRTKSSVKPRNDWPVAATSLRRWQRIVLDLVITMFLEIQPLEQVDYKLEQFAAVMVDLHRNQLLLSDLCNSEVLKD